jgi:hypothetical protein
MFYYWFTSQAFNLKAAFGKWWLLHIHIADVLVSICLATMLHLLVEAPTGRILGLAWKQIDKLKKGKETQKESEEKVCLILK